MAEGKIEEIGKIRLDLTHYPGEDLYCDGDVEDELLKIARDYAEVEYQRIIEERRSWPVLYHLSIIKPDGILIRNHRHIQHIIQPVVHRKLVFLISGHAQREQIF